MGGCDIIPPKSAALPNLISIELGRACLPPAGASRRTRQAAASQFPKPQCLRKPLWPLPFRRRPTARKTLLERFQIGPKQKAYRRINRAPADAAQPATTAMSNEITPYSSGCSWAITYKNRSSPALRTPITRS